MFSLIVFGLVPGALLAVLLYAVTKRGVPLRPAALACILAAWVFIPYVTIRPQALSWLLMAVLVTFLWGLDATKPRRALWLIPLFILWANLHGLWVVGLGVVALYALFTVAGRTPMAGPSAGRGSASPSSAACSRSCSPRRVRPASSTPSATSTPATGAWRTSTSGSRPTSTAPPTLPADPDPHPAGGRGLDWRGPGWMSVLTILGVAMSLISLRNAPLLAVWSVPVVAMGLAARWPPA